MNTLALGITAILGLTATPVLAADMALKSPPSATVYSWSGFYAGANAGYGWTDDPGRPRCSQSGLENSPSCQNVVPVPTIHASGFIGGAQAGYNWELRPNFVIGIETDFDGAAAKGSTTINGPFNNFAGALQTGATLGQFTASEKLNWFGTLRGRFGIVADHALIYATGGLAYGNFDLATNFVAPTFNFPATSNFTRFGYTVGGGVEWAYDARWSTKLEGLYYGLGKMTVLAGDTTGNFPTTVRGKDFELQGGIVRLGLNYKFSTD